MSTRYCEVAIIGAGFGGIGMAIRLKCTGWDDFVVLEQADKIGGTWRDNTYPGCTCDIPSHLYSLSFAPKADWSRRYASQPEIYQYLEDCVDRFRLRPYLRLKVSLKKATFDSTAGLWRMQTDPGPDLAARVLVLATGMLHRPAIPALHGIESFSGAMFHSARWDHAAEMRGKRVAVIGTGASAVQLVPHVANKLPILPCSSDRRPGSCRSPTRPSVRAVAGLCATYRCCDAHCAPGSTGLTRFAESVSCCSLG